MLDVAPGTLYSTVRAGYQILIPQLVSHRTKICFVIAVQALWLGVVYVAVVIKYRT